MATQPQPPKEYIEILGSMEKGVNYGIAPNLVKNNQLTSAVNLTVRGDYVNPRPCVRKIPITFISGSDIQTGLFQGAGVYEPDFGNASLVAAISGRLFQFQINGVAASCTEITIPGDLNVTTPTQSWLWQSENYMIVNDGTHLPIFWNGVTSRRSFGNTVALGQVSANFNVPAIGSSVVVSFASPYTGPLNSTVLVDNAFYQTSNAAGTYSIILTNVSGTPGADIPIGTQVFSEPSVPGVMTAPFHINAGTYAPGSNFGTFTMTPGNSVSIGDFLYLGPVNGFYCKVTNVSGASVTVGNAFNINDVLTQPFDFTTGTTVREVTGSPNVLVATTTVDATVPAQGSSVTVNSGAPYSGPANAVVYIGNAQYTIQAGPAVVGGNSITLTNINDLQFTGSNQNERGPNAPSGSDVLLGPGKLETVPELPAGRMGCYGMGRNWMSLTDGRTFIASDIVGGSSGTPADNNRDAPLRITENTFLFEGGVFVIPGSSIGNIRAMCFASTLDASLGQGALQVFTPTTVFSCNTPVDRTTWQSITNPILTESLISNGALGQLSTELANGDIIFRSIDGTRSLILARRDFDTWGNVPQSREVQPTLTADDPSLLSFGSSVVFDNRYLLTANPTTSANGVYHPITVALNFDELSFLNFKAPAAYDGLWTPFNVLQYLVGQFNGVQRCFAFVLNTSVMPNVIEIWEMLTSDSDFTEDNGQNPIVMDFSTGDLFDEDAASRNKTRFDYCRLADGELHVDEVVGPCTFQVFYKPDQYEQWVPWFSWSVDGASPFYPRMGLGEPANVSCDLNLNRPLREGYTFQIRIVITGSCRLLSAKFKAVEMPQPAFAPQYCPAPLPPPIPVPGLKVTGNVQEVAYATLPAPPPPNVNLVAIAYDVNGVNPTYVWNPQTKTWN